MTTIDSDFGTTVAGQPVAYERGSFYFAAPGGVLRGTGVAATVPAIQCARPDLPRRVREFLDAATEFGRPEAIVVGAVPFGDELPAQLVMPEDVVRGQRHGGAHRLLAPDCAVRAVPAPAEYERGVERALRRMADGELEKVVLARSLELSTPEPVDAATVVNNLALADPAGYTFAVELPRRGENGTYDGFGPRPELGRTFLGASPELLISRRGNRIRSNPMAGSRPRCADPAEDQRNAAELAASEKDQREHAAVVAAVAGTLRPYCTELHVPQRPSLVRTAAMWHLATEITGELADPGTSSLELADALHPTPAVCGTPMRKARTVIAESEPFERGYYAGMVGWCDASGDGEWVVAIRCADIEDESLLLYAGAGIVEGSVPSEELAETTAKFRTALHAMGLDQALRGE